MALQSGSERSWKVMLHVTYVLKPFLLIAESCSENYFYTPSSNVNEL